MALACLSLTLKACTNYLFTSSVPSFPSGLSNARVAPAAGECFVNVAISAVLETVPKRALIPAAAIRTEITSFRQIFYDSLRRQRQRHWVYKTARCVLVIR